MNEPATLAIDEERRIVEAMGCTIAAWAEGAMVIRYHEIGQRQQLIERLHPLGWLHPINDPGDAEVLLLDIRRAAQDDMLTMQSPALGLYLLTLFLCAFFATGMYDMARGIDHRNVLAALLSGTLFLLVTALVFYSGIEYVSLRVELGKKEITLANMLRKIVISPADIKECDVASASAFGAPILIITVTMHDGTVHKIPAPRKGFRTLKDALRQRYDFSVA